MGNKKNLKGLFIGSLLPSGRKPEAGIFYYKLIKQLTNYLSEIYIIYPQKISYENKNIYKKQYDFCTKIIRPYYLSLGFLKHFKKIYKYVNLLCLLTFYLAIKKSFSRNFSNQKLIPDFVYSHFISPAGLAAAMLSSKKNIPCFVAVGESSLEYLNNLPSVFLINFLKKVDIFISVNKKNARILNEKFGIENRIIFTIPNEADGKIFFKNNPNLSKKELGFSTYKKYILYVGTLTYRKGFDIFLKLAKANSQYNFIVIGRDPENQILEINKIKNIQYLGVQKQNIIAQYMNACDLFILFSRYEGSPNVLLEAKATGLPILCSNIEEHKEILKNDEAFFSTSNHNKINDNLTEIFNSKKYEYLSKRDNKLNKDTKNRALKILEIIKNNV